MHQVKIFFALINFLKKIQLFVEIKIIIGGVGFKNLIVFNQ
jgi:hypothetical protein